MDRDPIEARTVFISSRMDELAIERRSAFAAVYEAGFTPILFEMEPQKSEREKIDALVDRADLFLGIFYSTIGKSEKDLLYLCPIEYELFRFLTRFDICDEPESWRLTDADRKEISARMEKPAYLEDLQKRLRSECARREGSLYDVLRDRIRLFLRKHDPDNWTSRKLLEFLESLPKLMFGNNCIKPPETVSFVLDDRYVPSHLTLFDQVYRQLCEAQEQGRVKMMPPGDGGSFMRFDIEGEDQPGLLYRVLEVCFEHALNIKSLLIRKGDYEAPSKGHIVISLIAEPYYAHRLYRQTDRDWYNVERALRHRLRGYSVGLAAVASWTDMHAEAYNIPHLDHFYEVYTFDVPGIIMAVARLVSHLGGSIEFIYFGKEGIPSNSRYFSLVIGVVPLSNTLIDSERGRKGFEYELESVMGVASIFQPAWEVLNDRFNGHAAPYVASSTGA